ncbi:ABC transporter permease [Pilimelia columellifera]|uniref:ABC transporter permease n=1 Tax=Pilimelia columellifera subsp. columellifera TaxID=706583 RepID=A0ABN3NBV8_9ACTN
MITYIIRRLMAAVLLLVAVSMATFAIFFVAPRLLGSTPETLAARYAGKSATPETTKVIAEGLGFYDPVYLQYWNWMKGIFLGADYNYGTGIDHCPAPCFGYSFITQRPIWPDLLDRLPVTLSLALGAAVIWLFFGIATGVISALKRGSLMDRTAMSISLAGVSLPIFFTGMISLVITQNLGLGPSDYGYVNFTDDPIGWANVLLLPWVTLAFLFSAQYARLTRAGMLETMGEDYIRTARAKGLRERNVTVRHGLRGALTPILTIFGLDFGLLIGGAVLTEKTFSLPGLGKYALEGIYSNDLPKVMGVTIMAAFFVVIASLIVDLLYAVVDPRVRLN